MPYSEGNRLSGERASKLGHLEVVDSELVKSLVAQFESSTLNNKKYGGKWKKFDSNEEPLNIIFCVDGSLQFIQSNTVPPKELSFIKIALLTLDRYALDKIDNKYPHPMDLKRIMSNSALYHSTAFPLKGISLKDMSNYDAVRKIIFDSFNDKSLESEPINTLKWLLYEKWDNNLNKHSPSFQCPSCDTLIDGLAYDIEEDICPHCQNKIYITDIMGFHLDMSEDHTPSTVATAYMLVYETILLFTPIRFYWDSKNYNTLQDTLFLKDGPLSLNSQYSKLVIPIRNFFEYAKSKNIIIHMAGQEKTGYFVEHLQIISKKILTEEKEKGTMYFIPNNEYIDQNIRIKPNKKEPYGHRVNYGNKIFLSTNKYHQIVLTIPTGKYKDTEGLKDLLGIEKIIKTIEKIVSHKHEGALIPIQLANGIASLSTYPSAKVLKLFASKVINN